MMLTQETLKSLLHYDAETGIFTNRKARAKVHAGSIAGSLDAHGYDVIEVNRKKYKAHRLAWLYVYGTWPPTDIDHINRIRADNRLSNLRLATRSENLQNQSMRSDNTSGHVGVSWYKRSQKWTSQISINRKLLYLGYFTDLSEAIAARKAAEIKYHTFQHN